MLQDAAPGGAGSLGSGLGLVGVGLLDLPADNFFKFFQIFVVQGGAVRVREGRGYDGLHAHGGDGHSDVHMTHGGDGHSDVHMTWP